jgi:hypothetical protein
VATVRAPHDWRHARDLAELTVVILTEPLIGADELARRTGWQLKPEGLCRDDVCVPVPEALASMLDARVISERLGMPLVRDQAAGLWALGPESGRTLASANAPDFTLPDWQGREFSLSSLRGRKVLIVAWAPW